MPRGARPLFSSLFFFSGLAGLVYEVCWTRLLRLPMGNTVHSMAVVLTTFMAGLAIGSFFAGRGIDRHGHPLRVYALLEAAIGVFCLALPWIVQAESPLFRWAYRSFGDNFLALQLFKFAASGVVILVPATLMGATLPVLCRYFIAERSRLGTSLGRFYAVNALGAVAGSLLAGYVLIPGLGLRAAMLVGVAVSLAVAAIAARAQDRFPPRAALEETMSRRESVPPAAGRGGRRGPAPAGAPARAGGAPRELSDAARRGLLAAYGVSGLAAMVFQIAWARLLALLIGSSVYTFSLLVAAFILGLALGSGAAARIADRLRRPALGFAILELGIGATALGMLPLFQRFPAWMLRIVPEAAPNFGRLQAIQFGLIFAALLLPTACMGACLPLVGRGVLRGLERAGEAVGTAYSANAAGTIAGAFLGGFVLLPGIGAERSIFVGAALDLLVGGVILALALPRRRGLPAAAGVLAAGALAWLFLPRFDPTTLTSGSYLYAESLRRHVGTQATSLARALRDEEQILMNREGLVADVTVKESSGGVRVLAINGKVDGSTGKDMVTQELLGHLPSLLHAAPRDVAVVGLATGVTVHAVAMHPTVRAIDCIEIAPEMLQACRLFADVNGHVLDDPRLHLIFQDGRTHLESTDREYDLIISEPSNPWIAGIASLFTREFLQACRARLRPGGLMCLWMQVYGLDLQSIRSLTRTFAEVFPAATLWEAVYGNDYLLIGGRELPALDWDGLVQRLPAVAADLERVGVRGPADILGRHVADAAGLQEFARGGEVYRDDRNRLEFEAPRLMYHRTTVGELQALQALRRPGPPAWLRLPAAGMPAAERLALDNVQAAQESFYRGTIERLQGARSEAAQHFLAAFERSPRLPGLAPQLLITAREVLAPALAAGDTARVERFLRHVLDVDAGLADFHNELAVLLTQRGRRSEATEEYRRSVDLEPRSVQYRVNLALSLAVLGRTAEAETELRRTLEQRPAHLQARAALGKILLDRGDLDGAEREVRVALAADAKFANGWLLLGETRRARGELRPAVQAFEAAVRLDAALLRAYGMLAECYQQLGEPDKAASAAARAGAARLRPGRGFRP